MLNIPYENLSIAYKEVVSTIRKCEQIQPKFKIGSAQFSLLENRIKAMYISKLLIDNELVNYIDNSNQTLIRISVYEYFTKSDIQASLRPVLSIIHKCESAQIKHHKETLYYKRLANIINSMNICKLLIEDQLESINNIEI